MKDERAALTRRILKLYPQLGRARAEELAAKGKIVNGISDEALKAYVAYEEPSLEKDPLESWE